MKIEVGKFYRNSLKVRVEIIYVISGMFFGINDVGQYDLFDENGKVLFRISEVFKNSYPYLSALSTFILTSSAHGSEFNLIEEWPAEPKQVKPTINGVQVKVGQWWEDASGYHRHKIQTVSDIGIFSDDRAWTVDGCSFSSLVKLVEDVK